MISDMDKYIGKRLRLIRTECGMSQEDLAKEIGISFQQIQKYERGDNRISSSRLYQFTSIFQCPFDWFFPDDNKEGLSTHPSEVSPFHNRQTFQLMVHFNRIPDPELRKIVAALVKSIAQPKS